MTGFDPEVFRARLREAMAEHGWNDRDLAARTTMHYTTIRNQRTKPMKTGPSAAEICELCDALDVSADYLMGRDRHG